MLCVSEIHSAAGSRVEQIHNIYHEPICNLTSIMQHRQITAIEF